MSWESVYVGGTGAWQFTGDGLLSVREAGEDIAPPRMAVQAATAALDGLAESGTPRPGDRVPMPSAGPGTYGCAVLEISHAPGRFSLHAGPQRAEVGR